MDSQTLLVLAIIGVAAVYIGSRWRATLRGKSSDCGCGCSQCPTVDSCADKPDEKTPPQS